MNTMNDDEIWNRSETQSPCVKICVLHPQSNLCIGCLRTVDEIANWSQLDTQERSILIAALPDRKSQLKGKRRGRPNKP